MASADSSSYPLRSSSLSSTRYRRSTTSSYGGYRDFVLVLCFLSLVVLIVFFFFASRTFQLHGTPRSLSRDGPDTSISLRLSPLSETIIPGGNKGGGEKVSFSSSSMCNESLYRSEAELRDDQLTILVTGYNKERISLLQNNTRIFSSFPFVRAVYILWQNTQQFPLSRFEYENISFVSNGAPIHVIPQSSASLNNRFLPRTFIETSVVAIVDDDILVNKESLDFALKVWRENRLRIVGFVPRAHVFNSNTTSWNYVLDHLSEQGDDRPKYSMILTKLMLVATRYLFDYTCHTPSGVLELIANASNCEDIAMNFVVANSSNMAPLAVHGEITDWGYPTGPNPSEFARVGLVARPEHMWDRSRCLNEFTRLWGTMPLRYNYYKAVPI